MTASDVSLVNVDHHGCLEVQPSEFYLNSSRLGGKTWSEATSMSSTLEICLSSTSHRDDGHLDREAEGTSTQTDVVLRKFVSATHTLRVRDFATGRKRRVSVRLTTQPVLLERLCLKADTHLLPLAPHVFLCMSFYMFR